MTKRTEALDEAARLKRVAARERFQNATENLVRVWREWPPTREAYERHVQAVTELEQARVDLWDGHPPRQSETMERVLAMKDRLYKLELEASEQGKHQ